MDPFDFEALAERAATVEVGGKPVHLRLPSPEAKVEVVRTVAAPAADLPEGEKPSPEDELRAWNRGCAKALAACVADQDHVTEDMWLRIVTASGTDDDEGIARLVLEAMKLCGFKDFVDRLDSAPEAPDSGVSDHVLIAGEQVGNSRTK